MTKKSKKEAEASDSEVEQLPIAAAGEGARAPSPSIRRIRSMYDGQAVKVTKLCARSRSKQSFKDECDIERIVKQYQRTGVISHLSRHSGVYANVADIGDYKGAIDYVRAADEAFMELPSKVRSRFDNDPGKFIDFVQDPSNRDEMVELGLIESPASSEAPEGAKPGQGKQGPEGAAVEQPEVAD